MKELTKSQKKNLRALYLLYAKKGNGIHLSALADLMEVKLPTAAHSVSQLEKAGLVKHESYGLIYLTAKGKGEGYELAKAFNTVRDYFVKALKMQRQVAAEESYHTSHLLKPSTIQRMIQAIA